MDMDPEMGLEELVDPNGRHNLFKCSMCDIFCIVHNMLPPQYLSVLFSQSAAALADEGPHPPPPPFPLPPPLHPPTMGEGGVTAPGGGGLEGGGEHEVGEARQL